MPTPDFQQLSPELWIWQTWDASAKADLFSTAIRSADGLYIVDPIPLSPDQFEGFSVAGIIVTNANHQRSSSLYSDQFSVPIFAHPAAFPELKPSRLNETTGNARIGGDLEVVEIEGAGAGEIALYQPSNRGTLIVGGALINFEPYGFTFLPRKYCQNEKRMRRSLHQLRSRPAERILFAHGMPILSGAAARLHQLLESQ